MDGEGPNPSGDVSNGALPSPEEVSVGSVLRVNYRTSRGNSRSVVGTVLWREVIPAYEGTFKVSLDVEGGTNLRILFSGRVKRLESLHTIGYVETVEVLESREVAA